MGKKLFLFAAAAVALASCTETDLSGDTSFAKESTSDAIQFSAKTGNAGTTRAGDVGTITTASLKTGAHATSGFGVMGYNTGTTDWASSTAPNFMYNEQITWNAAGYWTYDPVKYWPNGIDAANAVNKPSNTAVSTNGDKLSFFAYAPWVDVAGSPSGDYSTTAIKTALKLGDDATGKNAFYATGCSDVSITSGIAAITANTVANDPEVFYYMPQAKIESSVDLLWGLRGSKQYQETDNTDNPNPAYTNLGSTYNVNLTKQDVPETVNFLFKHALSKVGGNTKSTTSTTGQQKCGLKVVVDIDGNGNGINGVDNQTLYLGKDFDNTKTLVTIKSVAVQDGASAYADRASQTNPDKNALPDDPAIPSDLMNGGWFNLAKGTWSAVTIVDNKGDKVTTDPSGATYNVKATTAGAEGVYKLDKDIAEPTTAITGILKDDKTEWTGDGSDVNKPSGVTTTAKNVYSDENDVPSLIMIPSGATAQTLYVTVDYIVRTADSKLSNGYSEVEQIVTNKVSLTGLDVNKYYTLVMHLGLTSVKFSAIVADWAESDNATYDEDGTHDGDATAAEEVWLPSNVVAYSTSTAPALGTSSNANVKASDIAYTVNLSGLNATDKLEITGSTGLTIGNVNETAYAANMTTPSTTPAIHVSFAKNATAAAKSYVLTIKQKNSEETLLTTTTVNIVQSAFAFALSASEGVVTVQDADGNNLTHDVDYTVVVRDSEGAILSPAGSANATNYAVSGQTVTLPTTAGTYTVTVTHKTANTITKSIVVTK